MPKKHLYSVGTYDWDRHRYTQQPGVGRSINVTIHRLRAILKKLRDCGYSAHRRRDESGSHDDNDSNTLVERTDGEPKESILKRWLR